MRPAGNRRRRVSAERGDVGGEGGVRAVAGFVLIAGQERAGRMSPSRGPASRCPALRRAAARGRSRRAADQPGGLRAGRGRRRGRQPSHRLPPSALAQQGTCADGLQRAAGPGKV